MGLAESALDGFHAGDEGGGDRAHAGDQHAQLAFRGRNRTLSLLGKCFTPLIRHSSAA